jgi:hypothetical protein
VPSRRPLFTSGGQYGAVHQRGGTRDEPSEATDGLPLASTLASRTTDATGLLFELAQAGGVDLVRQSTDDDLFLSDAHSLRDTGDELRRRRSRERRGTTAERRSLGLSNDEMATPRSIIVNCLVVVLFVIKR